jgi:hypothetical protein
MALDDAAGKRQDSGGGDNQKRFSEIHMLPPLQKDGLRTGPRTLRSSYTSLFEQRLVSGRRRAKSILGGRSPCFSRAPIP